MSKQLTVEQIDKKVDAFLSTRPKGLKATEFCTVYAVAKPILDLLVAMVFWKPKWQRILKILFTSLDANCPTQ